MACKISGSIPVESMIEMQDRIAGENAVTYAGWEWSINPVFYILVICGTSSDLYVRIWGMLNEKGTSPDAPLFVLRSLLVPFSIYGSSC